MRTFLRRFKTAALVVSLLCCSPVLSSAQVATAPGKTLLMGRDLKMYLVDTSAGTAVALSLPMSPDRSVFPSPDLNYIVVGYKTGLTLYALSITGLKQPQPVAATSAFSVVWATDGKSFVYTRDMENADGSVTVQIHQWDIATSQSKKLM